MTQQQPQHAQSQATDAAHSPQGGTDPDASRAATSWPPAESQPPADTGWLAGGLVFAGVLLLVNGLLAILQGISAIAADDVYARVGDYVFKANLTA